jgi:hypothetical protein
MTSVTHFVFAGCCLPRRRLPVLNFGDSLLLTVRRTTTGKSAARFAS